MASLKHQMKKRQKKQARTLSPASAELQKRRHNDASAEHYLKKELSSLDAKGNPKYPEYTNESTAELQKAFEEKKLQELRQKRFNDKVSAKWFEAYQLSDLSFARQTFWNLEAFEARLDYLFKTARENIMKRAVNNFTVHKHIDPTGSFGGFVQELMSEANIADVSEDPDFEMQWPLAGFDTLIHSDDENEGGKAKDGEVQGR